MASDADKRKIVDEALGERPASAIPDAARDRVPEAAQRPPVSVGAEASIAAGPPKRSARAAPAPTRTLPRTGHQADRDLRAFFNGNDVSFRRNVILRSSRDFRPGLCRGPADPPPPILGRDWLAGADARTRTPSFSSQYDFIAGMIGMSLAPGFSRKREAHRGAAFREVMRQVTPIQQPGFSPPAREGQGGRRPPLPDHLRLPQFPQGRLIIAEQR